MVTMAASDEHIRRPAWQKQFADGFGGNGIRMQVAVGVRILQIPMPWLGANTIRTEGEMSFDMQVVGKDLGYFYSGVVL